MVGSISSEIVVLIAAFPVSSLSSIEVGYITVSSYSGKTAGVDTKSATTSGSSIIRVGTDIDGAGGGAAGLYLLSLAFPLTKNGISFPFLIEYMIGAIYQLMHYEFLENSSFPQSFHDPV